MSEDLLLYAQLGRADHIARLVREGADPDWRREDGVTTLMMAAMTGRLAVMTSLLDSGATIDLPAPDGMTALLAACAFARTTREIAGVELLLARGADPNRANKEGNDALMLCARHGLVEGILALLEAGADPLRANRYGTTALMQAARGHLIESVRLLIHAGAKREHVDENGLDASRYAHELGRPPPELAAILAPSGFESLHLSRQATRFERPEFRLKLLGSWKASEVAPNEYELVEVTGERQIFISVTRLPAHLEPDERHDAIGRKVEEHMAQVRGELGGDCRFTEVRLLEAGSTTQARWDASSSSVFVAACVYATPTRFVTMSYRDLRPNLSEETRGRQAGESVASFRVK